jgi:hypothetical protein
VLDERGAARGALGRAVHVAAERVFGSEVLAQVFEVALHHHQQVVEVVRDATGEVPERLHFLRLAQHRLGAEPVFRLAPQRAHGGVALVHLLG